MRFFLLGLILGLLAVPAAVWFYLGSGKAPVAAGDRPFPFEHALVKRPEHIRIRAEMPKTIPIQADQANLVAGARIYRQDCAVCHGLQGSPSSFARSMYPPPPQLWRQHGNGKVGVSDDPPGETYWKVTNGLRLTGMPAFRDVLSETERWQVSLLVANANKSIPENAIPFLRQPLVQDPPRGK